MALIDLVVVIYSRIALLCILMLLLSAASSSRIILPNVKLGVIFICLVHKDTLALYQALHLYISRIVCHSRDVFSASCSSSCHLICTALQESHAWLRVRESGNNYIVYIFWVFNDDSIGIVSLKLGLFRLVATPQHIHIGCACVWTTALPLMEWLSSIVLCVIFSVGSSDAINSSSIAQYLVWFNRHHKAFIVGRCCMSCCIWVIRNAR